MHIAQNINREGFDNMKKEDVQEILAKKEVEPTNEELDEIAKQGSGVSNDEDGDESQPNSKNCPSYSGQNIRMEFCPGKKFQ